MTDLAGEPIHFVPLVASDHSGQLPQLAATVVHDGDGAVVTMTGEMDLASAPGFQRQVLSLLALPVERITLDLAGLTFIDSSGLRALSTICEAADEHDVLVVLRDVPDQARQVLDLTHLSDLFPVEERDPD